MEKECRRCFKSKPLLEYYQHKQMFDGHLNVCKECTKKRIVKHRDKNIESIKEYDRNRPNKKERNEKVKERRILLKENNPEKYQLQEKRKADWTINNKDKVMACRREWVKNNPEKRRAHCILNNAIRDKRIIKPKHCSVCGKEGLLHGHHGDYSKPLDVEWKCPTCHREFHKLSNI